MRFFSMCDSLELSLIAALGRVIPPQVLGRLVDRLFAHFEPKEPEVPPEEAVLIPDMSDLLEYTLYQEWMRQYLSSLRWRCQLHMKYQVRLDDFLDVPIYIRTWYVPRVDLSTFRFGVLFRIYDWSVELLADPPLMIEGK